VNGQGWGTTLLEKPPTKRNERVEFPFSFIVRFPRNPKGEKEKKKI
jgi:hypothetical protein